MRTSVFKNRYGAILMALLCAILWGSAIPTVKTGYRLLGIVSGDTGSQLMFAGIRFLAAGILDIIVASLIQRRFSVPGRKYLTPILTLGLVMTFLQYLFYYIALGNMTGAKGAVINSMGAFLTVVLAHFFYKDDRFNMKKVIGCVLGIAGIVIMNLGGDMGPLFTLFGDGLMIMSALSSAFGNIISKKMSVGLDAITLTGYQMALGGGLLLIIGLVMGGQVNLCSWKAILLMGYLACVSASAFVIWMLLLKYNPVGKITVFMALIPIFGTYLSGIMLHEPVFTINKLLALIAVATGIGVINYTKTKKV